MNAERGIWTFRDAKGLWENHGIMEVLAAEILLIIGSSMQVYPAASLISSKKRSAP